MIGLAGNKADLAHKRKVSFNEGKRYAEENGLTFMETSAKTAMNVDDIFVAIGMHFPILVLVVMSFNLFTLFSYKIGRQMVQE